MLENFIKEFQAEANLDNPLPMDDPHVATIPLDEDIQIRIEEVPEGYQVACVVCEAPPGEPVELYKEMMTGNLMGQGTEGAWLGLTDDGSGITLMQMWPPKMSYADFSDRVEDLINVIDLWVDEVKAAKVKLQSEENLGENPLSMR